MGNVNIKTSYRARISKFLLRLPNFFFGPTPRMLFNRNILEWKKRIAAFDETNCDDWDSALELSCDSENVALEYSSSPAVMMQKRLSYCCSRSVAKEELAALKEELNSLRLQINHLLTKELQTVPELAVNIPTPPPLTGLLEQKNADMLHSSTPKSSKKQFFKDITNVKLKPIDRSIKKAIGKSPDIRHDLHRILKKRYAAMHSPCPVKLCFNESEEENQFSCQNDEIYAY